MNRRRNEIRVGGWVHEPGVGWRQIVAMESAGSYINRMAARMPLGWAGSSAETCALHGGKTQWVQRTPKEK